MMILLVALITPLLSSRLCSRHTVKVVADDGNGAPLAYDATYWLCEPGAIPASKPVMMVCYEDGNPYGRELWAHPAHKPDVEWLCAAP